jgi:hypothetical protein
MAAMNMPCLDIMAAVAPLTAVAAVITKSAIQWKQQLT